MTRRRWLAVGTAAVTSATLVARRAKRRTAFPPGPEAITPETLRTWSAALRRLGDVYHERGRLARAEGTYASALEVARTLEAADPTSGRGR